MSVEAKSDQPDDSEPTPERQAELRAAYDANVTAGKAPYAGVEIHTRGELHWVMRERDWSLHLGSDGKDPANLSGAVFVQANLTGAILANADLSGAVLVETDLSRAVLMNANLSSTLAALANLRHANLMGANLREATLMGAELSEALLAGAKLRGARLMGTNFTGARLDNADLHEANMRGANLSGARLAETNLHGTDLQQVRLDSASVLDVASLDSRTLLADAVWNGAPLTRIPWDQVTRLGDEYVAHQSKDEHGKPKDMATRLREYQNAGMANRQVSTVLRSQGLNEHADRFTYRAQLMQREVLRRQKQWGPWLFSWVLAVLSGYSYKLWRILAAYGATLLGFACLYWLMGIHSFPHEPGWRAFLDSFLVSFAAIHGRAAFEQLGAWSPAAWTAAIQGVFGIVIEGVFIAMLIQRFFAR